MTEISSELNISVRTLYSYEEGTRQISIDKILPLAKLYDVTAEEIINAQMKSIFVGKPD